MSERESRVNLLNHVLTQTKVFIFCYIMAESVMSLKYDNVRFFPWVVVTEKNV